jgi:hydrogenase maturation protein HypF
LNLFLASLAFVGRDGVHVEVHQDLRNSKERSSAIAWDGTGLGSDGTIWGGEFLMAESAGFERVAHLWPVLLAGAMQPRTSRGAWRGPTCTTDLTMSQREA